MSRETFEAFLEGVRRLGVRRVRVVGNGEPTLHPDFPYFIGELARAVPYVSVLTNGQWKSPTKIIDAMLESPVSLIELSVEGGEKEGYESSRIGGRFERLIENLNSLKATKQALRSRSLTNIRLMLRPSERAMESRLKAFWSTYADTVMPQYLVALKRTKYTDDVYMPVQFHNQSYPKCSVPFKTIGVHWDGDVPLCSLSEEQIGAPGLVLGNVRTKKLGDLWNCTLMRQYREGHLRRDCSKMPICKGCLGG
jgi:MoaA/NifB/PqqE/SkfB family radical SAM enzyme